MPKKTPTLVHEFHVESLENRKMMAGDVLASVVNGDLVINGDNDNNELMIVGTGADGVYDIIAANGTAVNGNSAISVSGVTDDVRVNLRNGDNSLGVSNVFGPDRFRVRTGDGDDKIVFEESGSKNQLDIITRGGDDSVYLYRTGSRRINVRTGGGNDELALDDAQTQYFSATTGGGSDEMYFGNTVIVSVPASI